MNHGATPSQLNLIVFICYLLGNDFLPHLASVSLKNDGLGDPLVSREHILAFKWMDVFELDFIYEEVRRINDFHSRRSAYFRQSLWAVLLVFAGELANSQDQEDLE